MANKTEIYKIITYRGQEAKEKALGILTTPGVELIVATLVFVLPEALNLVETELKPLREKLESILTANSPEGFSKTEVKQNEWARDREEARKQYESDPEAGLPLILVLPEKSHGNYTRLQLALQRAGFLTVEQILEEPQHALTARGVDLHDQKTSQNSRAVQAIIDHFSKPTQAH